MDAVSVPSLGQLLLGGVSEIIGSIELKELFLDAGMDSFPSKEKITDYFQSVYEAIVERYGERGGKGIIFRAGSVFGKKLRQLYGNDLGLNSDEFRFLNSQQKVFFGIIKLAQKLNSELGSEIDVEDSAKFWVVSIAHNESEQFSHHYYQFVTGMICEFLNWAGGGKSYIINDRTFEDDEQNRCLMNIKKKTLDS